MEIREYVTKRLLALPLLIIGVSIAVFLLTRIGGSPIGIYVSHEMTAEEIGRIEERYHLDEPLPVQYLYWAGGVVRGDFGWSGVSSAPISQVFPAKLAATAELGLFAGIVAISLGVALGTFAGSRRDKPPDHVVRVFAISGASMPLFWFGILLLIIFWVQLGWFPIGRATTEIWDSIPHPTNFYTIDALLAGDFRAFTDAVWHMVLPAVTLGYTTMAIITRMMRSSIVEEMREDYVDAARAKGLRERYVLRRHVRRNALIPTVTVIGLSVGFLLEGTVVVELIFRWPGLGRMMSQAVLSGDQATIMAYVLFTAVLYLVVNLIVDVAYAYLDRRVVLGE